MKLILFTISIALFSPSLTAETENHAAAVQKIKAREKDIPVPKVVDPRLGSPRYCSVAQTTKPGEPLLKLVDEFDEDGLPVKKMEDDRSRSLDTLAFGRYLLDAIPYPKDKNALVIPTAEVLSSAHGLHPEALSRLQTRKSEIEATIAAAKKSSEEPRKKELNAFADLAHLPSIRAEYVDIQNRKNALQKRFDELELAKKYIFVPSAIRSIELLQEEIEQGLRDRIDEANGLDAIIRDALRSPRVNGLLARFPKKEINDWFAANQEAVEEFNKRETNYIAESNAIQARRELAAATRTVAKSHILNVQILEALTKNLPPEYKFVVTVSTADELTTSVQLIRFPPGSLFPQFANERFLVHRTKSGVTRKEETFFPELLEKFGPLSKTPEGMYRAQFLTCKEPILTEQAPKAVHRYGSQVMRTIGWDDWYVGKDE